MITTQTNGKPILSWTEGVHVEENAWDQLRVLAELPFLHKHIAVMPDVHAGIGSTVGTVMATRNAVVPSAVGVDIGCGVAAIQTNLKFNWSSDDISQLRSFLELRTPHGRSNNGDNGDVGAWQDDNIPKRICNGWDTLCSGFDLLPTQIQKSRAGAMRQLGTLGTGNHFLEIALDKNDAVWILVHTGSRGLGAHIGDYFSKLAYQDIERWTFKTLENRALAYIPTHSENFTPYIKAVMFAQAYARMNRDLILQEVMFDLSVHFGVAPVAQQTIECVHNYLAIENHFGSNVWVTRKGAVRARRGDVVIIPGSMGARTFIARGLGNPESFTSCSHGAGRLMSRADARKTFTVEDHVKATSGIECLKTEDVLDETPGAYKNIDDVMNAQKDLIEPINELRQIICIKGA